MPFLRKRSDRLGEEAKFLHEEREFSLVCVEKLSPNSDKISEVNEFFREFVSGECFVFWSS